jgi:hypothetical protein
MRVPEDPVCIHFFRQNPVFTSWRLKYPVHVVYRLGGKFVAAGVKDDGVYFAAIVIDASCASLVVNIFINFPKILKCNHFIIRNPNSQVGFSKNLYPIGKYLFTCW